MVEQVGLPIETNSNDDLQPDTLNVENLDINPDITPTQDVDDFLAHSHKSQHSLLLASFHIS